MTQECGQFGRALRRARSAARASLADTAVATHYHRAAISRIESGTRFPDRRFAGTVDRLLNASGALVAAWDAEHDLRGDVAVQREIARAAAKESETLAMAPDIATDGLMNAARGLATAYAYETAGTILNRAASLRREITARLHDGRHRPSEYTDLLAAAGAASGALAYAALDLGHVDHALAHARATYRCGELAGSAQLMAWTRGTQSLIYRFAGQFDTALDCAIDGMQYAGSGTALPRLLCGEAQCRANLGDSAGSNETLDAAQRARETVHGSDFLPGLFGFSEIKQRYYAGSSLIWLDDSRDAQRAAREASAAVTAWERSPFEETPQDDLALSRLYLATARLQLGELEGAVHALEPILNLPGDRRISWITARLDNVYAMLAGPTYQNDPVAQSTLEELRAY